MYWLTIFLLIIFSCSSSDIDQNNLDYNYIYSATIPQLIENNNVDRPFWVRAPKKLKKNKYPIIFFLHGNGGEAYKFYQNSTEIVNLIDDGHFIGIFPQGYLKSWNCGKEKSKADDVVFIQKIVDFIKQNTLPNDLMDFDNIYGVGISNGALMINKIAKETPIFKGIAPIISQQSNLIGNVVIKRPISLYQINGTDDNLIPAGGGMSGVGHVFLSAKQSAENWASSSNCELNNVIKTNDTWGNYEIDSYAYRDCDDTRIVTYHLVNGAGHIAKFGPNDKLYARIWNFFREN